MRKHELSSETAQSIVSEVLVHKSTHKEAARMHNVTRSMVALLVKRATRSPDFISEVFRKREERSKRE